MSKQRGFTLIELAIVLVILMVLAGGLLMPLTKRIEVERIRNTQQLLEDAKQALIGFAMSHRATTTNNPYLPCPDKMAATNLTANIPNDGLEDRKASGECEVREGNFPWSTLGVSNSDAWGNRLRYQVIPEFANSRKAARLDDGTAIDGANQLQVCTPSNCSYVDAEGSPGIPVISAVLVSHGPNGWGALNSNGTFQRAPTSTNEIENTDQDRTFNSLPPSVNSDAANEFDDLVSWLPTNVLISRVCPAGGCS